FSSVLCCPKRHFRHGNGFRIAGGPQTSPRHRVGAGGNRTNSTRLDWRHDSTTLPRSPQRETLISCSAQRLMKTDTTLLRHLVATLPYRAAKVLRDVRVGFAEFSIEPRVRVPVQILAHMADLMGWAVRMVQGEYIWRAEGTREWETEIHRFFDGLAALDRILASGTTLGH